MDGLDAADLEEQTITRVVENAVREEDFVFVPLDKVTELHDGYVKCLLDRYWSVHPEKGLAFYNPKRKNGHRGTGWGNPYGSPQCSRNESITNRIKQPWTEVRLVRVVYLPLIMNDYR